MKICVDTGYSEVKAVTQASDKLATLAFPSTFGEATVAENFLRQDNDEFIAEVAGKRYNIGETAIERNSGGVTTLDKNLFVKEYNPILTLAAIARLIAKHNLPMPTTLVVGLPIAFYNQQKAMMEAQFKGRHAISLFNLAGQKTQSYQLNISTVHVLPQGYMAFLSKAIDNEGKAVPEFMRGMVTVVDGGGKTIDITRVQNGNMLPNSTSIPTGLDDIYRAIQDECYARYDECPERPQIEYQIAKNELYRMQNGEDVDFKTLRQQHLQAHKSEILARLRQAIGQQRVGRLLVCGGSGNILFDLIKESYEGAEPLTPSIFANAIGGLKFANR